MFLYDFASRVYHVHIKDAAVNLNGRKWNPGAPHIAPSEIQDGGGTLYQPGHGDVDFDKSSGY